MAGAPQHVIPQQSDLAPSMDSSDYLYSIKSILEEEPYQSSLSDAADAKSDLGTLLTETLGDPTPVGLQSPTQPSPLVSSLEVDSPFLGRSQLPNLPMSAPSSSITQKPGPAVSVTPPARDPMMVELPPPRKKGRLELCAEDSGHSTALKDAQLVVKKYGNFANVADMGKLVCMLARQSSNANFFPVH